MPHIPRHHHHLLFQPAKARMAAARHDGRAGWCVSETGVDLLRRAHTSPLTAEIPVLDDLHGGSGFLPGDVVEVCGSSNTGKTLLLLHLLVRVTLPQEYGGRGATAVFVDCDQTFDTLQVASIIEQQIMHRLGAEKIRQQWSCEQRYDEFVTSVLARTTVYQVTSSGQFAATMMMLKHSLSSSVEAPEVMLIDNFGCWYWYDRAVESCYAAAASASAAAAAAAAAGSSRDPDGKPSSSSSATGTTSMRYQRDAGHAAATSLRSLLASHKLCVVVARRTLFTSRQQREAEAALSHAPGTDANALSWLAHALVHLASGQRRAGTAHVWQEYLGRTWTQLVRSRVLIASAYSDACADMVARVIHPSVSEHTFRMSQQDGVLQCDRVTS